MASVKDLPGMAYSASRRGRYRVPDDQRKRVRKACETCRKHKLRCDGALPCSRCVEMDKRCQYTPKPRAEIRRTVHDQTFARLPTPRIEDDEVQLMRDILMIEHPESMESIASLRALRDSLTLNHHKPSLGDDFQTRGVVSEDTHVDASPKSYVQCHHLEEQDQQMDPNASKTTASVTVFDQGKTRFEGNSSVWAFFDAARRCASSKNDTRDGIEHIEPAENTGNTIHATSPHRFGMDLKTMILNALPPKGAVEFLSSTFFRVAQSNYFCIHPEIYYRKLKAFYDQVSDFNSGDAISFQRNIEFASLLFMVLAIGAQFADVGTESTQENEQIDWTVYEHSPHLLSNLGIPVPKQNPGWQFCEVSRKLLPDVVGSSSMTSIQVCVLQGIFLPSTGSRDAGYNLLGLALRMAVNMGLHRAVRCKHLHPQVRELRNRLWWTVYVAERMYSIEMGRPLAISDSEVDACYPVETAESDQALPGVGGLVAMIDICKILGKIVQEVYCDATSAHGTVMRPMVVGQLKRELDRWRDRLPSAMRINARPFRRSVAHIGLMYEQAMILLTRPCLHVAILPPSSPTPNEDARKFLQQQALDCVAAAVSSIKLLSKLKSESLLCPFSMHDGIYCSSALHVLQLASKMPNIAPKVVRKDVLQGLSILMELAKGSELAAINLRYIAQSIATSHVPESSKALDDDSQNGNDSNEKGRKEWKAWVAQSAASRSDAHAAMGTSQCDGPDQLHFDGAGTQMAPTIEDELTWQTTANTQDGPAPWVPRSQHDLSTTFDPSSYYEKEAMDSVSWNLTAFIIPGASEFDIMERDLGSLPDVR